MELEHAPSSSRLTRAQVGAIAALSLALLCWSWWRVEGYELADAVEYLERAWAFSRGEPMIDNKSIRAVGFSALLLPLFLIAPWVPSDDLRWVPLAARGFQILWTLGLVLVSARIAGRLAGRSAALCAGLLMATQPVLLRWGVCPVSGVAGALCLAVGIEQLAFRAERGGERKRGWRAGLALGASLCLGYSVAPLVAAIVLASLWFGRGRPGLRAWTCLALACMVLLQCAADQIYYGRFGLSLHYYLVENFYSNVAFLVFRLGQRTGLDLLVDWGRALYEMGLRNTVPDRDYVQTVLAGGAAVRTLQSRTWYLVRLPEALTWGAMGLLALGSLRAALRGPLPARLLLGTCLLWAVLTSLKGSKDFRLWLHVLGPLAALAGLGWSWLVDRARGRVGRALAGAALAAALIQAPWEVSRVDASAHGAYWRAMAWLNQRLEPARIRHELSGKQEPYPAPTVVSAFHWAVFLRESAAVRLIKLPRHLGYWAQYSAEEKALDFDTLSRVDYFLTHLPELTAQPEILAEVSRLFAVEAAFYDRASERTGLGPVLVFSRRRGHARERVLAEWRGGLAPAAGARAEFRGQDGAFLRLVDYQYEPLPGDGWGWIRYRWHGGGFGSRNWLLVDRLTASSSPYAWQNNHAPGWGLFPTSTWGEGASLEEGYLVVPEQDAFRSGPRGDPRRFVGGRYLAGDMVPAQLWFQIADFAAPQGVERELVAVRPADRKPLAEILQRGGPPAADGSRLSADGYAWVGGLWLALPDCARLEQVDPGAVARGVLSPDALP